MRRSRRGAFRRQMRTATDIRRHIGKVHHLHIQTNVNAEVASTLWIFFGHRGFCAEPGGARRKSPAMRDGQTVRGRDYGDKAKENLTADRKQETGKVIQRIPSKKEQEGRGVGKKNREKSQPVRREHRGPLQHRVAFSRRPYDERRGKCYLKNSPLEAPEASGGREDKDCRPDALSSDDSNASTVSGRRKWLYAMPRKRKASPSPVASCWCDEKKHVRRTAPGAVARRAICRAVEGSGAQTRSW